MNLWQKLVMGIIGLILVCLIQATVEYFVFGIIWNDILPKGRKRFLFLFFETGCNLALAGITFWLWGWL